MNLPLQQRAGRNSPQHSFAPSYTAIAGVLGKNLQGSGAGVDTMLLKCAEDLLSANSVRFFLGANPGAGELEVTYFVKDDSGVEVYRGTPSAINGENSSGSFQVLPLLPKGYELWVNVKVTAGVYGNNGVTSWTVVRSDLTPVDPVDLDTTLREVVSAAQPGHALYADYVTSIINTDTIQHNVGVYVSDESGDLLVNVVSVSPGGFQGNVVGGLILNEGQSVKMKVLEAITPGKIVRTWGQIPESNQLLT